MSSKRTFRKLRPIDPEFWTVENKLPNPIPVSTAELDAIDRYFGSVLDDVFDSKPHTLPAAITTHPKGEKR